MKFKLFPWLIAAIYASSAFAAGQEASGAIKSADPASSVVQAATVAQDQQVSSNVAPAAVVAPNPASILPPNVSVERPKKRRAYLPGVGSYTFGEKNVLPPVVVPVGNEGTRVIRLSKVFPNRISTPFAAPSVIDKTNVSIKQDGSSLYISPKVQNPFVIYIKGEDPGDQVISLTIVPQDIPSQTIVLQSDVSTVMRQQKTDSYSQQIVDMLRRIAAGKAPEGFSEARMPNSVAANGDLAIIPQVRYSGSWVDIYRYLVVNNSREAVELSETSFYQKGVRAVSIFPNLVLQPGDKTDVYVIADKTVLDGGSNGPQ